VGQKLALPAGASLPAAPSSGTSASGSPAAKPAQANSATSSSSTSTASAPASGPPDEVGLALDKLAQQYGVDPSLVRALAWIETDGKPRRADMPGGFGYLTVTDKTFEYIQQSLVKRTLDRANPLDNLEAGVAYVASMLKWGGEEAKGLAAFLQGPGSVRVNGVRPAIEQEVKRVLALRDRLKQGGPTTATSGLGAGTGQSSASSGTQSAAPAASTAGQPAAPAPPATPTTEPKLSAVESTANLAAKAIGAARTVAGPNGRIGISGRNLVTGQRLSVGADQSFPAASVGKLPLLVEIYRQTSSGSLALSDEQRADLRAMIIQSDNDAANRLLELLKPRTINATLQTLGLVGTKLVNPFGLASATGNPANVTTPGDMTRLMELLASEQLVNPQASREMRGLLLQSQDSSKLRRGLPSDARLAHKSGWYEGVANDVGLITQGQSSYVLGVFTEGMIDAETANQAIAAVAKAVHGAWGPPSSGSEPVASRHR
jgi:beta-lactamase class A